MKLQLQIDVAAVMLSARLVVTSISIQPLQGFDEAWEILYVTAGHEG